MVLLIYISTFFCSTKASFPSLGQPVHIPAHSGNNMLKKHKPNRKLCIEGRSGRRVLWKEQPILGRAWNAKTLTALNNSGNRSGSQVIVQWITTHQPSWTAHSGFLTWDHLSKATFSSAATSLKISFQYCLIKIREDQRVSTKQDLRFWKGRLSSGRIWLKDQYTVGKPKGRIHRNGPNCML